MMEKQIFIDIFRIAEENKTVPPHARNLQPSFSPIFPPSRNSETISRRGLLEESISAGESEVGQSRARSRREPPIMPAVDGWWRDKPSLLPHASNTRIRMKNDAGQTEKLAEQDIVASHDGSWSPFSQHAPLKPRSRA